MVIEQVQPFSHLKLPKQATKAMRPHNSVLVPSGSLSKMLTRDDDEHKRHTDYIPSTRVKRLSVKEPRKSATDKKGSPEPKKQRPTQIEDIDYEPTSFERHVDDFEESKYQDSR